MNATFVSIIIMVIVMLMASIVYLRRHFIQHKFESFRLAPTKLITPRYFSITVYKWFRIIVFTWTLVILIYAAIDKGLIHLAAYFTMWNFILISVYFGLGSYLSIRYGSPSSVRSLVVTRHSDLDIQDTEGVFAFGELEDPSLQNNGRRYPILSFSGISLIVMFEICFTMVWIVDLVNWLVNFPYAIKEGQEEEILNFLSYNVHGMNAIIMVIDYNLSPLYFHYSHMLFVLIWALIYVCFEWIDFAYIRGEYSYVFLDPTIPAAYAWYLGLGAFHLLVFSLCTLCSKKCKHRRRNAGDYHQYSPSRSGSELTQSLFV